jgi:hypothetical protein
VSSLILALLLPLGGPEGPGQDPVEVEGQPLAAQVERVAQALDLLGHAFPAPTARALKEAGRDARRLQLALQSQVLLELTLGDSPALERGRAPAVLQQAGFTPHLIRIINEKGSTGPWRLTSPQSGPLYAGVAELSMQRQDQRPLRENENVKGDARFLELELFQAPPMSASLSGLKVEYALLLIYSTESGRRSPRIETAGASLTVEFEVLPAVPLKLSIRDTDGAPTTARILITDPAGHVYPPQAKRLAPDLFFQKQIYRHDGETVLLPPGSFKVAYGRGPEYVTLEKEVEVPAQGGASLSLELRRWVNPAKYGFYGGDHHIHAAGCAHYQKPSEGVHAPDMLRQVKGEGLNVGCLLTWGPCYDYQRQFFQPTVDRLSEPFTLLKYDLEVSGFGSQALGHVCLLNLKDQAYPGSEGSRKWPTWTTPVMNWAKSQGAVTGYAHSASGLQVAPAAAARRLMEELDRDRDGRLTPEEAARGLLPEDFSQVDADQDGTITEAELARSLDRAADQLPSFAVPEMNSVGAMEIFVTVPQGLCDFISAMDTARLPEWNCWYHLMNCGFPLKVSGETDFPCMSGTRVGQGRVYVRLGSPERLDFGAWCDGLARGRSYVSDGYAHALDVRVAGAMPGDRVTLEKPGPVRVTAKVAFGRQTPAETPYGGVLPREGARIVGDTVNLHAGAAQSLTLRRVEIVVNARRVASQEVAADDREHDLSFEIPVSESCWIAVRQFPQLHSNPVEVIVAGKPIRASRRSALWCIACIEQLWRIRGDGIAAPERGEARRVFDWAIEQYRKIAAECPEGS